LTEKDTQTKSQTVLKIHVLRSKADFPAWTSFDELAEWLHESLKPYEDTVEDIKAGMEFALSEEPNKGGFILLGEKDGKTVGALVMLTTPMTGFIPPNILLFVAVDPSQRGQGVGGKIVRKGFDTAEGDVKLHVEYDNPAKRLYERLGMTTKYAEMRYTK